jgi:hypothetical protein
MPNNGLALGIRDNHRVGIAADFLKWHIRDDPCLTVIASFYAICTYYTPTSYLERKVLCIPDAPFEEQAPAVTPVERILGVKHADMSPAVCALGQEIHDLVYAPYDFNPEDADTFWKASWK